MRRWRRPRGDPRGRAARDPRPAIPRPGPCPPMRHARSEAPAAAGAAGAPTRLARRGRPPCRTSSIARISSSCGIVPTRAGARNRWWPKISCWKRIFSSEVGGPPTKFAPRRAGGVERLRVIGGQPRSRPIRSIIAANGRERIVGRLLGGVGDEAVRVDAERGASACPATRAGRDGSPRTARSAPAWPPMIASASGRPSAPARTDRLGVPPTATQTGSGSCRGRGYTPGRRAAAR